MRTKWILSKREFSRRLQIGGVCWTRRMLLPSERKTNWAEKLWCKYEANRNTIMALSKGRQETQPAWNALSGTWDAGDSPVQWQHGSGTWPGSIVTHTRGQSCFNSALSHLLMSTFEPPPTHRATAVSVQRWESRNVPTELGVCGGARSPSPSGRNGERGLQLQEPGQKQARCLHHLNALVWFSWERLQILPAHTKFAAACVLIYLFLFLSSLKVTGRKGVESTGSSYKPVAPAMPPIFHILH